jgi:endonuclease/exonuclease/phosphatase (EEP) superfamily protein YafD
VTAGRRLVLRRTLLWLFAVGASVTLWAAYIPVPGRGPLDVLFPFTQLVALRPYLATALLALALAGLAVARRRRGDAAPFVLLLACSAAAWAQIGPRAVPDGGAGSRAAPGLTVLAVNTMRSSVAPPALAALIRRTGADVVALPETSAEHAGATARVLGSGERWEVFSDRVSAPTDSGSLPTSLLVRAALEARQLPDGAATPRALGQVRVHLTRIPGRPAAADGPKIAAVHPLPPYPAASQRDWRRDIEALAPLCRVGWIVAGDLNATLDHSPMRALLRAGCADAAATTGHGLQSTWTGGPLGVVRVVLDRVLTSGRWRATDFGVIAVAGSDHRAVWARITAAG